MERKIVVKMFDEGELIGKEEQSWGRKGEMKNKRRIELQKKKKKERRKFQ